jgi:hypothetical protein
MPGDQRDMVVTVMGGDLVDVVVLNVACPRYRLLFVCRARTSEGGQ